LSPAEVRVPAEVPVRHAATVVLVRPGVEKRCPGAEQDDPGAERGGLEVFTFRRVPTHAFAAGMLVFPGGAVDPRDADPELPWAGPSPASFCTALSADEGLAGAVVVAAVRETFEECGVLLAGTPEGDLPTGPLVDDPVWERRRQALIAGELTLARLLRDTGLVLRADLLRPWAHWLTPPGEPRRFDTRFFVAALPPGQQARDLGGEGELAGWISPRDALTRHRAGELPMLPPTLVTIEELDVAGSVPRLLDTPRRPRPVSPWVVQDGSDPDGAPRYVFRIDLDGLGGGEPGPVRADR
jgi:8-oxo-dGTP pyrophosphatase MutT (NUDIX family)